MSSHSLTVSPAKKDKLQANMWHDNELTLHHKRIKAQKPVVSTYRSFEPVKPAANKFLAQQAHVKECAKYRNAIRTVKPTVDTAPPKTHMHIYLKLRKIQQEEERLAIIERDNRRLLEKMSKIMTTKGRVDNHNDVQFKSLNKERRQTELLVIAQENHEILKRIQAKQPHYASKDWEDDFTQSEVFRSQITHYPQSMEMRASRSSMAGLSSSTSSPRKSSSMVHVQHGKEVLGAQDDKREEGDLNEEEVDGPKEDKETHEEQHDAHDDKKELHGHEEVLGSSSSSQLKEEKLGEVKKEEEAVTKEEEVTLPKEEEVKKADEVEEPKHSEE